MTKRAKLDSRFSVGDRVKIVGHSSQRGKFATVDDFSTGRFAMVGVTIEDFDDKPEHASGWNFWPDELEKVDDES